MGLSVQHYLFLPDKIEHLPRRLMEGLAHGKDAMPQHANTRQKYVEVIIENEDGVPKRILRGTGHYLTFDTEGKVHHDLRNNVAEALEFTYLSERGGKIIEGNIVDLSGEMKRKQWQNKNIWKLTKADLDLLASNIFGTSGPAHNKIKQAKGVAKKPPSLTFEAKNALEEIGSAIFTINMELDTLSDPALKGLIYEAARRGEYENIQPIWKGVSAAAERKLAVLRRRHSTTGIWFAVVELTVWRDRRSVGDLHCLAVEKCNSLKAAEEAARRLLIENAHYMGKSASVEVSILSDLEWDEKAGCRID